MHLSPCREMTLDTTDTIMLQLAPEGLQQLSIGDSYLDAKRTKELARLSALTCLEFRKLHVDSAPSSADLAQLLQLLQQEQQRAMTTAQAVFRLPRLQQVSGASSIFTAAEGHQLRQWQQLQTIEPPMSEYSILEAAAMSCWQKP